MKDTIISVKHLSKIFRLPHEKKNSLKERALSFKKQSYEEFTVLKDINFEVSEGEFFGIVGRNGSGKSTLLKLLGGIYQPTKGEIKVGGSLTPFIELGIGFNPELSGRDNVFLNGAILGLTRKEVEAKYDEIVDFAELERFMDQKLKNYSSGMQVRLAFAIAIQAHNEILLIDEVLAVGDANFQRKCFNVFRDIKLSGKTIIFVTHDMGVVQEYCDRALMLQDGEVVGLGNPRDIAMQYEIANTVNATKDNLATGLKRPNNPAVILEKLVLHQKAKEGVYHYGLDDDIVVDVYFEVIRPTKLQFNLYFTRVDGVYSAGINTTGDLKKFNPPIGKHHVTCTIKAGQLVKHIYSLGLAAYTTDKVPDLIDILDQSYGVDTAKISVIEQSSTQNGEFYITGKWKD
jgi:ABC-2 type transport system ATP-binding protein